MSQTTLAVIILYAFNTVTGILNVPHFMIDYNFESQAVYQSLTSGQVIVSFYLVKI